ncbi:MAG: B12-binding domain-containing radical SAM protein [Oligoflexia bacterium]|nr:B12-binding domain-containing radical SAM protein [Oligoflexia bacterium]
MKILLISTERLSAMEDCVCAPLGIMYLASVAKQAGHKVKLINLRSIRSINETKQALIDSVEWKPDLIGLSATSPYSSIFETVALYFRRELPHAIIIGGGPHSTVDNHEILIKGLVDICVLGEGEKTFMELIERIKIKKSYESIPGISYIAEGKVIEVPLSSYIENLDLLPFPAWEMIDLKQYKNFSGMADYFRWSATILTSRGCPYKCIYCHNQFGKHFRARSVRNVLDEIDLLYNNYGLRNFEFVDDIFNFNLARAKEILKGIREKFENIKIAFPNGLRADILDEEIIILLKQAGCWHVSIPIETYSYRMQKIIKKNLDLQKVEEAIYLLKKHKIHTRGFLMIGLPDEKYDEIIDSMSSMLKRPLNYLLIFMATPFNKTELQKKIEPINYRKMIDYKETIDYRLGLSTTGNIPYKELEKIRSHYYRKGILRFRNWKYWCSAALGLIKGGAFKRIGIILISLSGLGKNCIKKAGINIRIQEFEHFKRSLLESLH